MTSPSSDHLTREEQIERAWAEHLAWRWGHRLASVKKRLVGCLCGELNETLLKIERKGNAK
jgi:hypothetical protein